MRKKYMNVSIICMSQFLQLLLYSLVDADKRIDVMQHVYEFLQNPKI